MKLTLKAKEQTFKDFVLESASKQIELLKSDIDTFKKMYHSEMTPRETMYLDEAIAEKKKQLSNQQALLRKYQKIRSSATAEEIKAAKLYGDGISFSNITGSSGASIDIGYDGALIAIIDITANSRFESQKDEYSTTELRAIQKDIQSTLFKACSNLDKEIEQLTKKYKLKKKR